MNSSAATKAAFISPAAVLSHWQGHRRVTRRMIEAFPEDQLFTFAIGGMRTFGDLVREILGMSAPMVRGIVTGEWDSAVPAGARSREALLRLWDEGTEQIDALWQQIPPERFHERSTAFGMYEGFGYEQLLYVIDNEIHHRGQGYVYLRALGVEPPPFWDRT